MSQGIWQIASRYGFAKFRNPRRSFSINRTKTRFGTIAGISLVLVLTISLGIVSVGSAIPVESNGETTTTVSTPSNVTTVTAVELGSFDPNGVSNRPFNALEANVQNIPASAGTTDPVSVAGTVATATASMVVTWYPTPNVKNGMPLKKAIRRITKERPFRVKVRYVEGPKNKVVKIVPTKYAQRHYKWGRWGKHRVKFYRKNTWFFLYVGKGAGPWRTAMCSTYGIGDGLVGNGMAGGGILRANSMIVAHKTMRFGTKIEFSYHGRTCTAIVKDRGPYVSGRIFDLGPGTARALSFNGVGQVRWRILK